MLEINEVLSGLKPRVYC